jgi:glycine/sarcosine N-methyltransferase
MENFELNYNAFMANTTYDDFSQDYDRFVHWETRLEAEIPFIEARLRELDLTEGSKPSVLDAACGTGMHAIRLAQQGYLTAGADLSNKMVEKAQLNADRADLEILYKTAGFMHLQETFSEEKGYPFDALICLGNSLPHLTSEADIRNALQDFGACLKPGGLLILQNRNFDAVLAKQERWIAPQSRREGNKEWLFLRFYDFDPDGLITFNIVRLSREGDSPWTQKISTARLFPLLKEKLAYLLEESGFTDLRFYGIMDEVAFDPAGSENLVAIARKA